MFPHGEFIYKRDSDNLRQLDEEHNRIISLLDELASTCVHLTDHLSCIHCTHEQRGVCKGRLPSFFHDVIDLCAIHFYREECIIEHELTDTSAYTNLKQHHKAHTRLLREINQLISVSSIKLNEQKTDQAYREFFHALSALLLEHDNQLDLALMLCAHHKIFKNQH